MTQAPMSSGQLAKAVGVNVETLRFYERRGLLPAPERTASGHRRYGEETLELLRLIKRAQGLGFSLPDVGALLQAMEDPRSSCRDVCATVQEKIDHVNRLLEQLRSQRRHLVRVRNSCPDPLPLRRSPVLDELRGNPQRGRKHR
jgi:MerR family mercuric resistance operon transcriptional regulator